jgi:hypothetical protein
MEPAATITVGGVGAKEGCNFSAVVATVCVEEGG